MAGTAHFAPMNRSIIHVIHVHAYDYSICTKITIKFRQLTRCNTKKTCLFEMQFKQSKNYHI